VGGESHADYPVVLVLMCNLLILQFMQKLGDRLALLEHRLALLESQKPAAPGPTSLEELLGEIGLAYMLFQAHDRLVHEPHYDGYDPFLGDIFKCKITDNNRMEYAYKLKDIHDKLLEKAADAYKSKKK
jgi:hypothetical protein